MRLNIAKNDDLIKVIPSIYQKMENPPTFIFRSPTSQDCLNFMFGGNNIFEAVCNCFVEFQNKIELYNNNKPIEYATYKEFINAGLSGDAVYQRLIDMINEAKETEKKSQSLMPSGKKGQEVKQTTPQG